jgi:ATP:corrinoid adenosyltransferase
MQPLRHFVRAIPTWSTICDQGRDAIVWRGQQEPIDYVEAERAWEIARAAISSGLYKTVILDELNPTVDLELFTG